MGAKLTLLVAAASVVAGIWMGAAVGQPAERFAATATVLMGALALVAIARSAGRGNRDAPDRDAAWTGWHEFDRELERSRRHEKAFALVRVARAEGGLGDEADWPHATAARLALTLRQTDTVWPSGGQVYVLMPESGRSEARQVLARAGRAFPDLALTQAAAVAVFPEDGLTGGAIQGALDVGSEPLSEPAAPVAPGS